MVGPPGTGKTLLARAVAGEAKVPFFSVAGSSFVELFVGVGAARVPRPVRRGPQRAPAIVFVDEIDAIGARRSGAGAFASNDEREQTLNQLLSEMDGFDPATGIVVLAATNRPEVLDPALLRPGRFDRQVTIPLPNLAERAAILAVHCRDKRLAPDVDLQTSGPGHARFSGADLANLTNEAAIAAVLAGREVITAADFDAARDRLILGRREDSNVLLPEEKHAVAVHESGHALVAALSEHADPVAKVTILPAGQALGVTEQLPLVERHLYGEDYLMDSLAVRLGGRAAELVVLGQGSTGAANDLAGATDLATRMVREFGLSDAWARSVTRRGARCSSAAGAGTFRPVRSQRPPRRPSTRKCPGCCVRRRPGPPSCSPIIAGSLISSSIWCSNGKPLTVLRCTGSSGARFRPNRDRSWRPGGWPPRPPCRPPTPPARPGPGRHTSALPDHAGV